MGDVIEIKVQAPKLFTVDGVDYRVQFPVPQVAALEEKIGRSMKGPADWLNMQTKEVPDILFFGLQMYHADDADAVVAKVRDNLDPEQIGVVMDALIEVACPKAMERVRKMIAEAQERTRKGLPLPNAPSADVA